MFHFAFLRRETLCAAHLKKKKKARAAETLLDTNDPGRSGDASSCSRSDAGEGLRSRLTRCAAGLNVSGCVGVSQPVVGGLFFRNPGLLHMLIIIFP